ncbi:twin-arginine translocase TatA/TatE family subunit [Microbacterium sp. LMI1-1-1.1]|uniref:twin-arginine translocase TatA/TatE family subunit n=1 Tax=Microbacterium sp. LMI1-1-1.1 TaxID=3135223 RepID=UPI0034678AA4
MTFGLTIEKLLLIAVLAALIIGPERLPAAAEALGRLTRRARGWGQAAQGRLREELGPEAADVDWQRLDPRRYDPRRIVREALRAEPSVRPPVVPPVVPSAEPSTPPSAGPSVRASAGPSCGDPADTPGDRVVGGGVSPDSPHDGGAGRG